ncbi:MAG: NusA-like transcription termination signal-binding factor [Acidilobaceae archaeon]
MSIDSSRITVEELRLMSAFSELTRCTAYRCIIDSENNRVIFLVDKSDYGRAVGKNGKNVRILSQVFKRPVEIVRYPDKLEEMIRYLFPAESIENFELQESREGKVLIIKIREEYKGRAIGKNGRNIKRARLLLKTLFGISRVQVR